MLLFIIFTYLLIGYLFGLFVLYLNAKSDVYYNGYQTVTILSISTIIWPIIFIGLIFSFLKGFFTKL